MRFSPSVMYCTLTGGADLDMSPDLLLGQRRAARRNISDVFPLPVRDGPLVSLTTKAEPGVYSVIVPEPVGSLWCVVVVVPLGGRHGGYDRTCDPKACRFQFHSGFWVFRYAA